MFIDIRLSSGPVFLQSIHIHLLSFLLYSGVVLRIGLEQSIICESFINNLTHLPQ